MKPAVYTGLTVAGVLFLIVYIALFAKLVSLGSTAFSGDIGPAWLPIGHIENSAQGFTAENKIGSIVIPLAAGVIAGVCHYYVGPWGRKFLPVRP